MLQYMLDMHYMHTKYIMYVAIASSMCDKLSVMTVLVA